MGHVDAHVADRQVDRLVQARIVWIVGISGDGVHWRDQRELIEHLVSANIAGVQNQLDAGEYGVQLRPDEPMRVRDESDEAGGHECPLFVNR